MPSQDLAVKSLPQKYSLTRSAPPQSPKLREMAAHSGSSSTAINKAATRSLSTLHESREEEHALERGRKLHKHHGSSSAKVHEMQQQPDGRLSSTPTSLRVDGSNRSSPGSCPELVPTPEIVAGATPFHPHIIRFKEGSEPPATFHGVPGREMAPARTNPDAFRIDADRSPAPPPATSTVFLEHPLSRNIRVPLETKARLGLIVPQIIEPQTSHWDPDTDDEEEKAKSKFPKKEMAKSFFRGILRRNTNTTTGRNTSGGGGRSPLDLPGSVPSTPSHPDPQSCAYKAAEVGGGGQEPRLPRVSFSIKRPRSDSSPGNPGSDPSHDTAEDSLPPGIPPPPKYTQPPSFGDTKDFVDRDGNEYRLVPPRIAPLERARSHLVEIANASREGRAPNAAHPSLMWHYTHGYHDFMIIPKFPPPNGQDKDNNNSANTASSSRPGVTQVSKNPNRLTLGDISSPQLLKSIEEAVGTTPSDDISHLGLAHQASPRDEQGFQVHDRDRRSEAWHEKQDTRPSHRPMSDKTPTESTQGEAGTEIERAGHIKWSDTRDTTTWVAAPATAVRGTRSHITATTATEAKPKLAPSLQLTRPEDMAMVSDSSQLPETRDAGSLGGGGSFRQFTPSFANKIDTQTFYAPNEPPRDTAPRARYAATDPSDCESPGIRGQDGLLREPLLDEDDRLTLQPPGALKSQSHRRPRFSKKLSTIFSTTNLSSFDAEPAESNAPSEELESELESEYDARSVSPMAHCPAEQHFHDADYLEDNRIGAALDNPVPPHNCQDGPAWPCSGTDTPHHSRTSYNDAERPATRNFSRTIAPSPGFPPNGMRDSVAGFHPTENQPAYDSRFMQVGSSDESAGSWTRASSTGPQPCHYTAVVDDVSAMYPVAEARPMPLRIPSGTRPPDPAHAPRTQLPSGPLAKLNRDAGSELSGIPPNNRHVRVENNTRGPNVSDPYSGISEDLPGQLEPRSHDQRVATCSTPRRTPRQPEATMPLPTAMSSVPMDPLPSPLAHTQVHPSPSRIPIHTRYGMSLEQHDAAGQAVSTFCSPPKLSGTTRRPVYSTMSEERKMHQTTKRDFSSSAGNGTGELPAPNASMANIGCSPHHGPARSPPNYGPRDGPADPRIIDHQQYYDHSPPFDGDMAWIRDRASLQRARHKDQDIRFGGGDPTSVTPDRFSSPSVASFPPNSIFVGIGPASIAPDDSISVRGMPVSPATATTTTDNSSASRSQATKRRQPRVSRTSGNSGSKSARTWKPFGNDDTGLDAADIWMMAGKDAARDARKARDRQREDASDADSKGCTISDHATSQGSTQRSRFPEQRQKRSEDRGGGTEAQRRQAQSKKKDKQDVPRPDQNYGHMPESQTACYQLPQPVRLEPRSARVDFGSKNSRGKRCRPSHLDLGTIAGQTKDEGSSSGCNGPELRRSVSDESMSIWSMLGRDGPPSPRRSRLMVTISEEAAAHRTKANSQPQTTGGMRVASNTSSVQKSSWSMTRDPSLDSQKPEQGDRDPPQSKGMSSLRRLAKAFR